MSDLTPLDPEAEIMSPDAMAFADFLDLFTPAVTAAHAELNFPAIIDELTTLRDRAELTPEHAHHAFFFTIAAEQANMINDLGLFILNSLAEANEKGYLA